MATFEFTSPDGQKYRIDGPEGATEAQAFEILQQQLGELPAMQDAPLGEAMSRTLFGKEVPARLSPDYGRPDVVTPAIEGILSTVGPSARSAVSGGLDMMIPGFTGPEAALPGGVGEVDLSGLRDIAVEMGLVDPLDKEITPGVAAARGVGQSLPFAAGGLAGLAKNAPALLRSAAAPAKGFVEGAKRVGSDVLQHFTKRPKLAAAEEAAGAAGAGGAANLASEVEGVGGLGEFVAGLAGGVAGGVTPAGIASTGRRAATGALEHLFPFTPAGAGIRAARQMQSRAADPETAAQAAQGAPAGVSPARATQDPGLMATEARVLADDPALAARTGSNLEQAADRSIEELATMFGPGSNLGDWQHTVMSRVAAPGATVPKGQTDEMLKAANETFDVAYDSAKGFPIYPKQMAEGGGEPTLRGMLYSAVASKSVMAGKKPRRLVREWLDDTLADVESHVARGARPGPRDTVQSDVLLEVRSRIRKRQRREERAGITNEDSAARAELLDRAQRRITDVLESQLPPEVSAGLRATDTRYSEFKTVENAVLRSGEAELNPARLVTAMRQRTDPGTLARGEAGDLQTLARQGADVGSVLYDPAAAKRLVRDMTPEQVQTVKADTNTEIMRKARKIGADGVETVSGKNLTKTLNDSRESLKAMGYTDDDLKRMDRIAKNLAVIEGKSPGAVAELLEDTPSSVMRFVATLAGAKWGQRLAGGGLGSSIKLANFGSDLMNTRLKNLTKDSADELIRLAMTDKDLFAALLTRPTDPIKKQHEAAALLQSYLAPATIEATDEDE